MAIFSIKDIPPCIESSVAKTFEVQVGLKSKVVTLSLSPEEVKAKGIDCLSSLVLESKELTGTLSIAFPKDTLLKVLETMLGETHDQVTPENSDASGEILNIIYASARKTINEGGFDFAPALPTTVIGKDLTLAKSHQSGTALYFDCASEAGPFAIMLSLRKKAA